MLEVDYFNLGAGAEIGIYKEGIGDHWFTAPYMAMSMTLKLYNKYTNEELINYMPTESQWWITGFKPTKFTTHEVRRRNDTIEFVVI